MRLPDEKRAVSQGSVNREQNRSSLPGAVWRSGWLDMTAVDMMLEVGERISRRGKSRRASHLVSSWLYEVNSRELVMMRLLARYRTV